MGLRSKVENRINVVFTEGILNFLRRSYIAMDEGEVWSSTQTTGVIQGSTIVKLIIRDDVVFRVGEGEMTHKPASTDPLLAPSQMEIPGIQK